MSRGKRVALWRVLVAAIATVACALASANPVETTAQAPTDSDIADYRAQVEFRCRDAAAVRGESREQVALGCGCLMEGLVARVPAEAWREAVSATRGGDAGAGQRLISPYVQAEVGICRTLPDSEKKRLQAQYALWPMLRGTWTRSLPDGCQERFTFRQDGRVVLVRGGNVMEQEWKIYMEQPSASRVHFTTRVIGNNGGSDCSGQGRRESAGQQGDVWVFVDYANARLYSCASRDGRDCSGPLRNVPGS